MIRFALLMMILVVAAGCSNKWMYDSLRMSQQANCDKYEGIQREKCLADVNMSYHKYNSTE